jgi:hypothetical protein
VRGCVCESVGCACVQLGGGAGGQKGWERGLAGWRVKVTLLAADVFVVVANVLTLSWQQHLTC